MFTDRAFGGKEAESWELFGFIGIHRKLDPDWINKTRLISLLGLCIARFRGNK